MNNESSCEVFVQDLSSDESSEDLSRSRVKLYDIPSTSQGVIPNRGGDGSRISNQTQIHKIDVNGSSNVHIGPNTVYQGPVTTEAVYEAPVTTNAVYEGPVTSTAFYEGPVTINITEKNSKSVGDDKNIVKPERSKFKYKKGYLVMALIFAIFVVITVILVPIMTVTRKAGNSNTTLEVEKIYPNKGNTTNNTHNDTFRIITRYEWQAKPPKTPSPKLTTPVPNVVIAHTAGQQCVTTMKCSHLIRNIQDYHINEMGFNDIGYNFLVGGNGDIYEGRGWDKRGAHSHAFNNRSIGIAFIGLFTETEPTTAQINATQDFLMEGMKQGKLTTTYKLFGQLQLFNTKSPGLALFKIIHGWSHWSDQIHSFWD